MARPLRIEYPNAVYHVTSRGNARNEIFADAVDRKTFLSVLGAVVARYHWLCCAYCLMGNHYHLIIETPEANLSAGMRQLNGIYTQKFNRRHGSTGHVFQGRFNAILVDKENYLLELCRYVALNPVRAGFVEKPEEWSWSSYAPTAGFEPVPKYLSVDWVLGLFGKQRTPALAKFRAFVEQHDGQKSPWEEVRAQVLLGKREFVDKFKRLLGGMEEVKEIPRSQRFLTRPGLHELFRQGDSKSRRNRSIEIAHLTYGYLLKEIADFLGIHYTTVSKIVGKGIGNK